MSEAGFLGRLTEEDRAELSRRLSVRSFAPDTVIIEQEDASTDIYMVLDGVARAELRSLKGKTVSYSDIPAGEIFGEIAAIDRGERSATVAALGEVRVGTLGVADFWDMIRTRPSFNEALLHHLAAQSRRLTSRIFEYSVLFIRERLIIELLRSAERLPGGRSAIIRPAPRHHELANRITCHREAVSREMSKLKKLGLIDYADGDRSIRIRKIDALEAMLAETDS